MRWRHQVRWLAPALVCALAGGGCERTTHGIQFKGDLGPDSGLYDLGPASDADLSHDDSTCATQSEEVGLLPLDMLIALDTSFSMDFDSKWTAVRQAVKAFASKDDFAGLGVGIQYFPLRKQCSVADYSSPAVPITALPGAEPAIASSLDEQRMYGGTPMVPMLAGVLEYARKWASDHPERKIVIVLATDGIPDDTCLSPPAGELPNTVDNVVQIATAGVAQSPSVSTFVIGVGSELTALNQIAQAGNGSDAILVDTTKNIEQAFLAALNAIRKRALACDYAIPEPATGTEIDFERVNVSFTAEGKTETFVNVGDKGSCTKAPSTGWYYDDPVSPEKLVLCPDACDRVLSSPDGALDVEFGCATVIR